ncbi:helix-turn-helix transcriptional regulator [Bacillus sp. JJ1773]|uniref:helix-turn-helix domain-containing protein n=1 Tax=Bacillus sp. JJ1773 TaxID=3122965 RepID=UPI003000E1EE
MKVLGTNIKEIREFRGLTQIYVSRELGYKSPSMLSEIESGKKGLDAEKIPQLAEILNVSINQIFFGINIHELRIKCNEERG